MEGSVFWSALIIGSLIFGFLGKWIAENKSLNPSHAYRHHVIDNQGAKIVSLLGECGLNIQSNALWEEKYEV